MRGAPVNSNTEETHEKFTSVRERREALGVTQQQLADLLGCAKSYISMLESGDRELRPELHRRIADAFEHVERERDARRPAVEAAVTAAFAHPEMVALRRRNGLNAQQGRNELQDLRMDARHG